jgi:hypothetical protein
MKTYDRPPFAPSLVNSTRFLGYTIETAIADLIDNSITANATNIRIFYSFKDNPRVIIFDDGSGMSKDELDYAMTYGYDSTGMHIKEYGLGRYGLGMKTASLSQCRNLTVISKKNGIISSFSWDIDVILETGQWKLIEFSADELDHDLTGFFNDNESGTMIVWSKLDLLLRDSKNIEKTMNLLFSNVRNHLELVFHRFINPDDNRKKINIYIQNNPVKSRDPFIVAKSKVHQTEPAIVTDERGNKHKVYITPFTLPHLSRLTREEINSLGGDEGLTRNQGFYLYREKRLINYGNWFGLVRRRDIYKLSRVRVDIPRELDYLWNLDVKKSNVHPPEVIIETLKKIIDKILDYGGRVERFRAFTEKEPKNKLWLSSETREGKIYSLNRDYPLLKELIEKNDSKLDLLFKTIENELPIHQILVDSGDDQQFAIDQIEYKKKSYMEQLKKSLKNIPIETRVHELNQWLKIYPFDQLDLSEKEFEELMYVD